MTPDLPPHDQHIKPTVADLALRDQCLPLIQVGDLYTITTPEDADGLVVAVFTPNDPTVIARVRRVTVCFDAGQNEVVVALTFDGVTDLFVFHPSETEYVVELLRGLASHG